MQKQHLITKTGFYPAPAIMSTDKKTKKRGPAPVLTVNGTAEFLNVSRGQVYRLLKEADLPAHRVGDRLRFSRREVLQWLEKRPGPKR